MLCSAVSGHGRRAGGRGIYAGQVRLRRGSQRGPRELVTEGENKELLVLHSTGRRGWVRHAARIDRGWGVTNLRWPEASLGWGPHKC